MARIKKIKTLFNRLLISVDATLTCITKRVYKLPQNRKNVLIVFQQIFGDAVIFSDSLRAYEELYPKEEGYNVILVARPAIIKFMETLVPLPTTIQIEPVDFTLYVEKYKYYRDIKKKYSRWAGIVIVPGTSLSAEIFSTACHASRRVGLIRSVPPKWPPSVVWFQKLAYTETVCPDKELMMLQRHRLLLNYLGLPSFVAKLPILLKQNRIVEGKYCVLCPGASKMEKCWPPERFAKVIDYVIEKHNLDVHLCGGAEDVKYEQAILNNVKFSNRVYSHIGKTTFAEWASIVQYACLVLGNDSATIHIAAAARVPSVCIAGVYDKFQFFPYKVDYLGENEFLPTTIVTEMPCEWCRTLGYYSGYNNKECKDEIDKGRCALCVEKISVDMVIEVIKQIGPK